MNLGPLVRQGVETAFQVAGPDVVGLGTYIVSPRGDNSSYDPVTDTTAPDSEVSGVRMILTGVDAQELAGTIVTVTDVKVLIPEVDLPGIEPNTNDIILLRGTHYNVTRYKPIPTGALHIIFCRAR